MILDKNPLYSFSRSHEALSVVKECLSSPAGTAVFGVEGSLYAVIINELFNLAKRTLLVVAPGEREAAELASDLAVIRAARESGEGPDIVIMPAWGTLPYRALSQAAAVFGERTAALTTLADEEPVILIASERAFLTPVPPPDYFKNLLFSIQPGDIVDTAALAARLALYGYTRVTQTQVPGEFVCRGEVLDIFMSADTSAYRVSFDFNRVDSIKQFNPMDQSGGGKVTRLVIRPMKEVVWTDDLIETLEKNSAELPEDTRQEYLANGFSLDGVPVQPVTEQLAAKRAAAGEELWYPLAFEEKCSLLDFAASHGPCTPVFLEKERLMNAGESILREYQNSYRSALRETLVPPPETQVFGFAGIAARAGGTAGAVSFLSLKTEDPDTAAGAHGARITAVCDPARSFFGNIDFLKEEFETLLSQGWSITVASESGIQARRIAELLGVDLPVTLAGQTPEQDASLAAAVNSARSSAASRQTEIKNRPFSSATPVTIIVAPLSAGFALPRSKLLLVTEAEIFGRRSRQPKSLKTARSKAIDTFVELEPGDYVVHVQYGIGLFQGIERICALGRERDYVKLGYAGDETVFVPIEQVNLVQRYIGNEGAPPRLDKLGSKSWEGRKARVKKSVEDIADQLVILYSKRKASPGFAFPQDTEWQTIFEAAFPFEETEDQLRCVEEIKADMESPFPMDRLVCGDVGYGKTEVAVRACFKAVMGGKQIAFLAPTTILAEQHYENFIERFSRFPVRVAMLSRLVDAKTTRKVLKDVREGTIDLLVGTHRIIQKDVAFKDLGLIVIDEEQRFGVKDKERLKEFKTNVDCLALSATPIPRTLHMSLLKIRDMSILATPPQNRQPIETMVEEWSEERVAKAIRDEAARGGQIFFLHNRIEDLEETRLQLQRLVPELLIETAHGQMDPHNLEDVMHRFIHGGFHVLVSTTIVENGIDIPNVNTIIIDRADRYGVSQLYQLRGRVGRSDRLAYAYLLYPKGRALSEVAMKRLQVISDFTELGSGFKIAMKDMEIRGAGNLLGAEQSGDILSVGFDLYLRLLDEAIRKLEDENYAGENETLLDLEYSGFIPDSYIDNPQQKMEVYKKIASIRTREECDAVTAELADRFGPLPDEAESLLALADIRIICRDLAVSSLRERNGLTRVAFSRVARINVDRLMRLIKEGGGKIRLDPKEPNVILLQTGGIGLKEKSVFLRERLEALAAA